MALITQTPSNIYRQLLRADGTVRKGVLVKLIHEDTGKVAILTTDGFGQVDFDTTLFPDGNYRIEYHGDGILSTVLDANGNKAQEDPQTPWEYEVLVKNPSVTTRSQVNFRSLVFKKPHFFEEYPQ